MKKHRWVYWVVIAVFAAVFLYAAYQLYTIFHGYSVGVKTYENARSFVTQTQPADDGGGEGGSSGTEPEESSLAVDFDALCAVNDEVIGWLYCPDTVINYPVALGTDNEYYLYHLYDGTWNSAGTLFVDCGNTGGFSDANILIYGHHMKNGTMFRCLDGYETQEYYEEHPVMWLLTPAQNYKVVLFSAYVTPSDSDTYAIYSGVSESLYTYLEECKAKSDFTCDVNVRDYAKFVVLSTCNYDYDDARYVVHGALQPVDTVPAELQ